MKPLITLIKQKEQFYEMAIQSILKEEILRSLHGKVSSHLGCSNTGSCLCWSEIFVQPQGRDARACLQKAISAFIPAIASLAKIAVESLSTFLQQKGNKAMAQGLNAIRN